MSNEKISIHNRSIEPRMLSLSKNKKISNIERDNIKEFLRLASIGKINLRKKISEGRILKYLDLLIVPLNFFKKDLDKISIKDMETFIEKLDNDTIKKRNKQSYSSNTKSDVKRVLKIYLKWRIKNIKIYDNLTNWIDMSIKKKTPDYLKESEIQKLYNACQTAKQRFLIAVLFDSGARAEEFLNIRVEDIVEPTESFSYYKIHLKEEYSKTNGRNVGLYWKHSTEAMREYLEEIKGKKLNEPVIQDTYDGIRVFLNRLGKKVLNRRVYFHLFRHSSATYYSSRLNRQQLCIRFGWKFTSDMPDVYIVRAGVEENDISEKFKNTDIGILRIRLEKAEQTINMLLEEGRKELIGVRNKVKILRDKKFP